MPVPSLRPSEGRRCTDSAHNSRATAGGSGSRGSGSGSGSGSGDRGKRRAGGSRVGSAPPGGRRLQPHRTTAERLARRGPGPGPGQYDVHAIPVHAHKVTRAPSPSFGGALANVKRLQPLMTPSSPVAVGPGSYTPYSPMGTAPAWSPSSSIRLRASRSSGAGAGAGAGAQAGAGSRGRSGSFSGRVAVRSRSLQRRGRKPTPVGSTFGSTYRDDFLRTADPLVRVAPVDTPSPGPGAESPTRNGMGPTPSFGTSMRFDSLAAAAASPGPGAYSMFSVPDWRKSATKGSHGGGHTRTRKPHLNLDGWTGSGAVFGGGDRFAEVVTVDVKPTPGSGAAAARVPGPGHYTSAVSVVKRRAPRAAFGVTTRDQSSVVATPDGPTPVSKDAHMLPGAGHYNDVVRVVRRRSPTTLFGTSQRPDPSEMR